MISRFTTLLAAIILAVTPTVRTICDLSCVTVPAAVQPDSVSAADHCAAPAADADAPPAEPAHGEQCGHQHAAADLIPPSVKQEIGSSNVLPGLAIIVWGGVVWPPTRAAGFSGSPPGRLPLTRPLPLRI